MCENGVLLLYHGSCALHGCCLPSQRTLTGVACTRQTSSNTVAPTWARLRTVRARSCPARPRASPQPSTVADVPAASGAGVMPAPSQQTELFSVSAVTPARPITASLLELSPRRNSCYQQPAVTTDKKHAAAVNAETNLGCGGRDSGGAAAAVALHTSRAPPPADRPADPTTHMTTWNPKHTK